MKHKRITIGVSILCVAALATGTTFAASYYNSDRAASPSVYEIDAAKVNTESSESLPEIQKDVPVLKEVSGAMKLMQGFTSFYGDYFEENKDKTLRELRETWEATKPDGKTFEFRSDGDTTRPERGTFEFRSEDGGESFAIRGMPGLLLSGDFYEANKDKTLAEAKEAWLNEVKEYLNSAVDNGTITRETADAINAALTNGDISAIMETIGQTMPRMERGSVSFGFGPAMGGMFSGDYYEQNKDKTLRELRGEWLDELKAKLDEAVASGSMTQEQADSIYEAAEQGQSAGFGSSRGGRGFKSGGDAPSFEKETTDTNATATRMRA